jgi:hypothetical protein
MRIWGDGMSGNEEKRTRNNEGQFSLPLCFTCSPLNVHAAGSGVLPASSHHERYAGVWEWHSLEHRQTYIKKEKIRGTHIQTVVHAFGDVI